MNLGSGLSLTQWRQSSGVVPSPPPSLEFHDLGNSQYVVLGVV